MALVRVNTRNTNNDSDIGNIEANFRKADIYNYTWDPENSRLQQPQLPHHSQGEELQLMSDDNLPGLAKTIKLMFPTMS